MSQIIVVKNSFDRRDRDVHELPADYQGSVEALVGEYIPAGVAVNVSINGHVLARDAWPTYALAPRDQVVVIPHVAGDDFNPLAAVLMLAVVVAAGPAAYALYGAAGGAMSATAFAASAGGMLMTAGIGAHGDLVVLQNSHQPEGALE